MFTKLVRIGCDFMACCGGLAKYQTCLIFHQPSQTLDPNCNSIHLETVLSCLFMCCHSHFQIYSIMLLSGQEIYLPNVVFKYPDITPRWAIE